MGCQFSKLQSRYFKTFKQIAQDEEKRKHHQLELVPSNGREDGLITTLPIEINIEILSRLPTISLSQCRWVCKSWYNLIHHNTSFASAQHAKAIQNDSHNLIFEYGCMISYLHIRNPHYTVPSFWVHQLDDKHTPIFHVFGYQQQSVSYDLIGSCNGLLCVRAYPCEHQHYIGNPITGQKMRLPDFPKCCVWVSGFGFEPVTNRYKVVWIVVNEDENRVYTFQARVLTLGLDCCWRKLSYLPYHIPLLKWHNGICFRGSLHWLGYNRQLPSPRVMFIVSFDMANERFGQVPLPSSLELNGLEFGLSYLRLLGGSLSFITAASNYEVMEVWLMKQYGVQGSWKKQYSIYTNIFCVDKPYWPYLVTLMHNGDILFQFHNGDLFYYDPIKKVARFASTGEIHSFLGSRVSIPHLDSLISPENIAGLNMGSVA